MVSIYILNHQIHAKIPLALLPIMVLLQNANLGFIGLTMTTKQLMFEIYDVAHNHTKLVKTIIIQ